MADLRETADARTTLLVAAVLVSALAAGIALAAGGVPPIAPGGGATAAEPANLTRGLAALHAGGTTGENVTVAVLDPTGFDPDDPALSGRVAETRSFASGEGIRNGGENDHGTAAAALVARTAPGATLYLASFDTAPGFRAAVAWLLREEVDVVVAPAEFYGKPGNGDSAVARTAARAARDIVFVAPVGNLGESHWAGEFDPAGGVHRFGGGPRNYLLGGDRTATLWLSWSGEANATFALELYRTNGTASRLVARSQPYAGDDAPNERIVAEVDPRGTYYVVVRGPPAANGTRIEISSPSHALQYRRRAKSVVAPATAGNVVAVGAYDRRERRVAPFSSAGPVDGRPGVDVVAPHRGSAGAPEGFVGSSAAAAHVAGVSALVLDANPALTPAAVEGILRTTARDVGPPGTDPVAGAGVVDARRAVGRARNATQTGL